MTGWNEDNFLERMACPDAETLGLVMEGAAGPAAREAVTAHMAVCPACAELGLRLSQFSSPVSPVTESEWKQTEQRLDARMHAIVGSGVAQPRRAAWWDVRSWNLLWLLAPAAALAMATFVIWVRPTPHPAPVETTARVTAPPVAAVEKPAPGIANMSAVKKTDAELSPPPPVVVKPTLSAEANTIPPAQPTPEPAPAEAASEPPPVADPVVAASPAPSHLSMRRDAGLVPVAGQTPGRSVAPPAASPAPVRGFVRINAGTRVWILLKSTSPQTNGDFRFRGMVLLPVTQAGAVLLDRETEVVGIGKVSQGRTTIQIVEFVWQGARYKLRGASTTMAVSGPGAGPAVEFNAGQVLETWLAAVSTYEREPGGAPPQG